MKVETVKIYDFKTGNFKLKNESNIDSKLNSKINSNYIKFLSAAPYPITSKFQQQELFRSKGHTGIDFAFPNGEPLRSIQDGVIVKIVDYGNKNIGQGVLVKWEDGKTAIYGHMSKIADGLKVGDKVDVGQLLGYSGNSGHVVGKNGGYHLHFGLKNENGEFIDPSPFIDHIQNMNNLPKLYALTDSIQNQISIKNSTVSFTDLLQSHSDMYQSIFESFKLHLFNLLSTVDYTIFIQYFQHLLKFFS